MIMMQESLVLFRTSTTILFFKLGSRQQISYHYRPTLLAGSYHGNKSSSKHISISSAQRCSTPDRALISRKQVKFRAQIWSTWMYRNGHVSRHIILPRHRDHSPTQGTSSSLCACCCKRTTRALVRRDRCHNWRT